MKNTLKRIQHLAKHPYSILPGTPNGIINSAREWVNQWELRQPKDVRRGPAAAYWEFDTARLDILPPPYTIAKPVGEALRIFPQRPSDLFFLKGARIIDLAGVIISPDNKVFAEFTYVDQMGGIDSHSIFRRRRYPKAQPLSGWYATLCYPSSRAYYHWMIESLPRLHFLENCLDALDGIFVPDGMPPSMIESLRVMGVKDHQVIPMSMGTHYAPEHLLIPGYCAGLDIPSWIPAFYRERVLNKRVIAANRRLYVSRAGVSRRRIINESEVSALLSEYGFETIRPENMSFVEQAELFASAEIVVGPSGAALSNIVFCSPGSSLLTLQPHSEMIPHVFYSLACAAGMYYWDIAGIPHTVPEKILDEHVDFKVDPALLARTLDAMITQKSAFNNSKTIEL